jgi:hypothetical protein
MANAAGSSIRQLLFVLIGKRFGNVTLYSVAAVKRWHSGPFGQNNSAMPYVESMHIRGLGTSSAIMTSGHR